MSTQPEIPENLHLPFVITPGFSRRLGEVASYMPFAEAVVDTLDDSGIKVEFEGDTPPSEGGLLIASDHGQRIEPLLVQKAMTEAGRDGSHIIAMPISFSGRLLQDSGEAGKNFVIPVMPSALSTEYDPSLRDDPRGLYRKLRFPRVHNQPPETLKGINDKALDLAAHKISNGHAVTIFPTGGSIDAKWRNGLGKIAHRLPLENRDTTEVSLLQADPFSVRRVASAIALREVGIRPIKQTLVLRGVNAGKISDIYPSNDTSQAYPHNFTQSVRELYRNYYGK